ncbi:MAG: hypothetical protein ACTH0C_03005, partial [Actinomycetaceae bacterium]
AVNEGLYANDMGLVAFGSVAAPPRADGTVSVSVNARYSERDRIDAQGERIEGLDVRSFTQFVLVERIADSWVVVDALNEDAEVAS